jgi:hypothetical protein
MDLKAARTKRKIQIAELRNGGKRLTTVPSYIKKESKDGTTSESIPSNSSEEIKVLLFNSHVHLFGYGKLHNKWEGPYLVLHIVDHGAVTLQCNDGDIFKANDQCLRLFLEQNPQDFKEVDVHDFPEL